MDPMVDKLTASGEDKREVQSQGTNGARHALRNGYIGAAQLANGMMRGRGTANVVMRVGALRTSGRMDG